MGSMVGPMFDGRIYRAAFVPFLFVLVIAGFSLSGQASPLGSTLAPDAFNGPRAFAGLQALVKRFPDRRPGSAGDNELAAYIATQLRGLGGLRHDRVERKNAGIRQIHRRHTGCGHRLRRIRSSTVASAGGGFQVSTRQIQAATIEGTRTLTTVIAERPGSTGLSPIVIMAHRDAPGVGLRGAALGHRRPA